MAQENNQRDTMRYMLITYYRKADGNTDEGVALANRVKPKDLQTVNVILDFKDQVVLKCRMGDIAVAPDWMTIMSYYYKHYPKIIERLLAENGYKIVEPQEPQSDPSTPV